MDNLPIEIGIQNSGEHPNGSWRIGAHAWGKRRYMWKSLEASDPALAQREGLRLLHQTEDKIEEGLPVQTRSLNAIIDEYIQPHERDHNLGKAAKRRSSSRRSVPVH